MMSDIGTYRLKLVKCGWVCNACGHITYSDKIEHKCKKAPHFFSTKALDTVGNLTKQEVNIIKIFINKLKRRHG